jgi:uncharacterized damage-inducible protein DinB
MEVFMGNTTLGQAFLKELEAEAPASRKCLERVPEKLFDYKPHEKSMKMGYLAFLVADMLKWIQTMAEGKEIDVATWKPYKAKNTAELVDYFDKNMQVIKKVLQNVSDEALTKPWALKNNGKEIMSMPAKDFIASSINHLVHHRGQLTVYMRLNNIAVPPIYGPSADERDVF